MEKKFFNISYKMYDELVSKFNTVNDPLSKQVIASYFFGMVNGLAQEMGINVSTVHACMLKILCEKMEYSTEQATQLSQLLINSTDKSFHPTIFAIIHRGIEGYYYYKNNQKQDLHNDLSVIIDTVNGESKK